MTAVPEPVLAALDRLNSHARANGCGARAIYAYKTVAAIALGVAGEIEARPFQIGVKCRDCDGTGRFRYWDEPADSKGAPCRTCRAKGTAVLKFIETRHIGHERVWHHPVRNLSYPTLRASWGIVETRYSLIDAEPDYWILADGTRRPIAWGPPPASWEPNRPGERLDDSAAAEALNVVEAFLLDRETREMWPRELEGYKDTALREMRRYRLRLDREPEPCWRCGAAEDLATVRHCGSGSRLLDFSRAVCQRHSEEKPIVWPTEPNPECLTPPVREWIARHTALGFDTSDRDRW
jgi:hypothetical protein